MNRRQERKRKNELNLLKFINPSIEYIFKIILKSRIKNKSDDDLIINYPIDNKKKLIDLPNYQNIKNPHIFEYNIDIFFCGEGKKYLEFIVENWKFIIDTTNIEFDELKDGIKKKLFKKLHTFARSIQSLQCLLPLNSLIRDVNIQNFDYRFKAQIYKESNIDMGLEKEIKMEKKAINLGMKEDKCVNIQLTVNYITRKGILIHQDNLKKAINYNEYYTKWFNEREQKTNEIINNINNINSNLNNNNDINNELASNFSQLFEKVENDNEIMLSNIIQNSMIDKKEVLNGEDFKKIEKDINDKKNTNLEKLYSSCFDNIEDINCTKNIDDILDIPTIMNKENNLLNNVMDSYNHASSNKIIDEIYEEIEGVELKELIRNPPKSKKGDNNKGKENINFKDIIDDYFDIKQILNNMK